MTMKVPVRSLAGDIELPARLLTDRRAQRFVDTMAERGGIDRTVAERYVGLIVAHTTREFAERLGRELGARVGRIMDLRKQLKDKYTAVVDHFGRGRGGAAGALPADLQPQAFRRLFIEMADEIRKLEQLQPRRFAETHPPALGVDVGAGLKAAPKLTGGAKTLNQRLDDLEWRYEPTLRQYPNAPKLLDEFGAIRDQLARGELEQAARRLQDLERDLRVADVHTETVAPRGSAAAQRREAGEPEAALRQQRGRTALENIEGLRRPPDLPLDAPQIPLDRMTHERLPPASPGAVSEQHGILTSGKPATAIGNDFEAFIKRLGLNESPVARHGRRPDVGDWEITVAGMSGRFAKHKIQQFWLDLLDRRAIRLIVPVLSPEAAIQLRQLAQAAETLIQRATRSRSERVSIEVIETLP